MISVHASPSKKRAEGSPSKEDGRMRNVASPIKSERLGISPTKSATKRPRPTIGTPSKASTSQFPMSASPSKKAALGDKSNHRGMQSPTKQGHPGGQHSNDPDDLQKMSPTKQVEYAMGMSPTKQVRSVSPSKKPKSVSSSKGKEKAAVTTPPPAQAGLSFDQSAFKTPAANVGRAGQKKYRQGEMMDAAMGIDLGFPEDEQSQTKEEERPLTEEELYPEIEYMPPSDLAYNPPYHFPDELDGFPRFAELAKMMASIPLHGFVSKQQAMRDPSERDRFKVDLDKDFVSFDDHARETEEMTRKIIGEKKARLFDGHSAETDSEDDDFSLQRPLGSKKPARTVGAPAPSKVMAPSKTAGGTVRVGATQAVRKPATASTAGTARKVVGPVSTAARTTSASRTSTAAAPATTSKLASSRIVINRGTSSTAPVPSSTVRKPSSNSTAPIPSSTIRKPGTTVPGKRPLAAVAGNKPAASRIGTTAGRRPTPGASNAKGASTESKKRGAFDWKANEHDELAEWVEKRFQEGEAHQVDHFLSI